MLNAIISGKAGRTKTSISIGESWREVFQANEDLLTATVFERLSYLPPHIFWSILSSAYFGDLQSYNESDGIELTEIQFWPNWTDITEHADIVEPDVLLKFHINKLNLSYDLIIEAKRHSNSAYKQEPKQWIRQIKSYFTVEEHLERPADIVCFLALGGLSNQPALYMKKLAKEYLALEKPYGAEHSPVRIMGRNWDVFVKVIDDIKVAQKEDNRLISDVLRALSLCGYRPMQFFDSFISRTDFQSISKAIQVFKNNGIKDGKA